MVSPSPDEIKDKLTGEIGWLRGKLISPLNEEIVARYYSKDMVI